MCGYVILNVHKKELTLIIKTISEVLLFVHLVAQWCGAGCSTRGIWNNTPTLYQGPRAFQPRAHNLLLVRHRGQVVPHREVRWRRRVGAAKRWIDSDRIGFVCRIDTYVSSSLHCASYMEVDAPCRGCGPQGGQDVAVTELGGSERDPAKEKSSVEEERESLGRTTFSGQIWANFSEVVGFEGLKGAQLLKQNIFES